MKYLKYITLACIAFIPLPATAAPVLGLAASSHKNQAFTAIGLEDGIVSSFGYGRRLDLSLWQQPLEVWTQLRLPIFELDAGDIEGSAGARISLLCRGPWHLRAGISTLLRKSQSRMLSTTSWSLQGDILPSYVGDSWTFGLAFGYQRNILTYLRHGEDYLFHYPQAQSGWYTGMGGSIRAGVLVGLRFVDWGVVLRMGALRTASLNARLVPFYASLGVQRGF